MPLPSLKRLRGSEQSEIFTQKSILLSAVILGLLAAILTAMGRVPYCSCGIGLWSGDISGPSNSQHLLDAYSFSHVLHGVLFYWLLSYLFKQMPAWKRLLFALTIELCWETLENTPMIINRYRDTASEDYLGDSVLNSTGDMLSVILGFWIAARVHWKATLALIVLLELAMLFTIRDNLTLNIIMLLYPIPAIREWQMAL